jgi:hypothetical protein
MAMACNFFGLSLEIFTVKVSYHHKPYRRVIMDNFGATVYASPTDRTHAGRAILAKDAESPGSLGIAISEAVETAATSGGTKKYALGSVLGHVITHQTVIGLEALEQMEMAGEYPDVVVGCAGGGSSFAGLAYPFVRENLTNGKKTKIIAVEPASCPSITRGKYAFDYGDTAASAPVMKMHTLGHTFIPPSIHAGGLRYHGMSPTVSALGEHGDVEARAPAARDVRGGSSVLEGRRHPARARERARGARRDRRRPRGQEERSEESDRAQPLRPRSLRHDGLRRLPPRPALGSRLPAGTGRRGDDAPPEGLDVVTPARARRDRGATARSHARATARGPASAP